MFFCGSGPRKKFIFKRAGERRATQNWFVYLPPSVLTFIRKIQLINQYKAPVGAVFTGVNSIKGNKENNRKNMLPVMKYWSENASFLQCWILFRILSADPDLGGTKLRQFLSGTLIPT